MIARNTTPAIVVAESWKAGLGWSFLHKSQTDVIKVGYAMYYSTDCGILYYIFTYDLRVYRGDFYHYRDRLRHLLQTSPAQLLLTAMFRKQFAETMLGCNMLPAGRYSDGRKIEAMKIQYLMEGSKAIKSRINLFAFGDETFFWSFQKPQISRASRRVNKKCEGKRRDIAMVEPPTQCFCHGSRCPRQGSFVQDLLRWSVWGSPLVLSTGWKSTRCPAGSILGWELCLWWMWGGHLAQRSRDEKCSHWKLKGLEAEYHPENEV